MLEGFSKEQLKIQAEQVSETSEQAKRSQEETVGCKKILKNKELREARRKRYQ